MRRPDVFDATTTFLPSTIFSMRSNSGRLMSRRSSTASMTRSHSATFSRSSSRLPVVTRAVLPLCMNDAGLLLSMRLTAPSAKAFRLAFDLRSASLRFGGTMSNKSTGSPAFAT